MLTNWEKNTINTLPNKGYEAVVKNRQSAAWDMEVIDYALTKVKARYIVPHIDERIKTRELAKKMVSSDGLALKGFPKFNKDKEILQLAIGENKAAIIYANISIIEKSPNTVKAAIKAGADFSRLWMTLSGEFRKENVNLIIDIINSNYGGEFIKNSYENYNLGNIPKDIINNDNVAFEIFKVIGSSIFSISTEKQQDEKFIYRCLHASRNRLEQISVFSYISDIFKNNPRFFTNCYDLLNKVEKSLMFSYFTDPVILNNESVRNIIANEITYFHSDTDFNVFSKSFFSSRIFTSIVVKNTNVNLSVKVIHKDFLENDIETFKLLIEKASSEISVRRNTFGVDEGKDAVEFLQEVYSKQGLTLSDNIKKSSELKKYFLSIDQFNELSENDKKDPVLVAKFLRRDLSLFQFIGEELKFNKGFILPYIEKKPELIEFLPPLMKIDPSVVKTCLNRRYLKVIELLPKEFLERRDYVHELVNEYPGNFIDIVNKTPLKDDEEFIKQLKRSKNWDKLWQTEDIDYTEERIKALKEKGIAKNPSPLGYNVNYNQTFPGAGVTSYPEEKDDEKIFHISFFLPKTSLNVPSEIFEHQDAAGGGGLGWHHPSKARSLEKYTNAVGWIGGYVSKKHNAIWIDEIQSDLAQRTPTMRDPKKVLNQKTQELSELQDKLKELQDLSAQWKPQQEAEKPKGKSNPIEGLQARVNELTQKMQLPNANKDKLQEQINNFNKQIENIKARQSQPQAQKEQINPYLKQIEVLNKQITQKKNEFILLAEDAKDWIKNWDEFPEWHEYRSRIENSLRDWVNQFFNTAIKLAVDNGIGKIYLATAAEVKTRWLNYGTPASIELLKRIYDGNARKYGFVPSTKNPEYSNRSGTREIYLDKRNMWDTMKPDRFTVYENGQEKVIKGRYYPEFSDEDRIAYVPSVRRYDPIYKKTTYFPEEPVKIQSISGQLIDKSFFNARRDKVSKITVDRKSLKDMMVYLPRSSVIDFIRTVPPVEENKSIGGYWELDLKNLSPDKYAKNWIKRIKLSSIQAHEENLEELIKNGIKNSSFCRELFKKFNIPLDWVDSKLHIEVKDLKDKYSEANKDLIILDKKLANPDKLVQKGEWQGKTSYNLLEDFHFIVHELWHWLTRQKEDKSYFADPEEKDAFIAAIKCYIRTTCSRCSRESSDLEIKKKFLPLIKNTIKDDKKAEQFLQTLIDKAYVKYN